MQINILIEKKKNYNTKINCKTSKNLDTILTSKNVEKRVNTRTTFNVVVIDFSITIVFAL